jgi:hypothetical protein
MRNATGTRRPVAHHDERLRIDAMGCFAQGDVTVTWRDEPRPTTLEIEALIEDAWRRRVRGAEATGTLCFDGPLCRLVSFEHAGGRLALTLGPASYRDMVGTNDAHPELAESHGEAYLATPLAAGCALVSRDGELVIGRRSPRVARGGWLHVLAGHVEPVGHEGPDGLPSPFVTIRVEAGEELLIAPEEIESLVCTGLARVLPRLKAELSFSARLAASTERLVAAMTRDDPANEHTEAVVVPDEAEALATFLAERGGELVCVGRGALLLHGRVRFGGAWFEAALAEVVRRHG